MYEQKSLCSPALNTIYQLYHLQYVVEIPWVNLLFHIDFLPGNIQTTVDLYILEFFFLTGNWK